MKYKDLHSFENHVKKSAPDHFSHCYAFLLSQDDERRYLINWQIDIIRHFHPDIEINRIDPEGKDLGSFHEEISSFSLFHKKVVHIFDPIQEFKGLNLQEVGKWAAHISSDTFLIFGSSSKEKMQELYKGIKKDAVFLDLSEEKPWHRKERMIQLLTKEARKRGKVLEPRLVDQMLVSSGLDLSSLLSTLEKMALYAKDDSTLTLDKVRALLPPSPDERVWNLAEEIVWSKHVPSRLQEPDSSDWTLLLGALRYHLQLGLKIAEKLLQGQAVLPQDFPKVSKTKLVKYQEMAAKYQIDYFRKGIISIFDFELDTKSEMDHKDAFYPLIFHFQREKEQQVYSKTS